MRALLKNKRLVYFYICRGELSGICEPHTVYSAQASYSNVHRLMWQ